MARDDCFSNEESKDDESILPKIAQQNELENLRRENAELKARMDSLLDISIAVERVAQQFCDRIKRFKEDNIRYSTAKRSATESYHQGGCI